MVREYVGSRYVPKFMGTYDATQSYEVLCVVDNGLGTSYISKIPTPAGTPLTDTDHWAIYGATSGAIINLQNQIDNIENVEIPGINSDIQDIQDYLDNLKTPVEKNILLIGNSYIGKGVCNILLEQFDHSYSKVSDGAGFVAYTGHSVTFEDLLDDAIADNAIDKDTITDILFVSAAGDPRAYDEGSSAYNNALASTLASINTKISANFTNCRRTMVTFAEIRDIAVTNDSKYSSLFAIHRTFKLYASMYNFQYLGWCGFDSMFNANNVMTDHLHPTAQGAERIGSWLRNSYNGHAEYHKFTARNTSMNFQYTSTAKAVVLVELLPDYWNFEVRGITATNGESVTLSANDILMDFNEFTNITIPGPSYYDTHNCTEIKTNAGGSDQDWLVLAIGNDSNGVCQIKAERSATAATVSASALEAPMLNNVILM